MLERKDVKIGDLLIGLENGSLRKHPIVGTLYIVVGRLGYGANGIFVMEVKSGNKFHSHARWFKKTDNFCP